MTACSSKNKGDSSWGLHRGDDKGEFVEDGQTKSVRVATLLSNESLTASEEICDVKKCIERPTQTCWGLEMVRLKTMILGSLNR